MSETKVEILRALDQGESLSQLKRRYSTKTVYKYYRLWLLIQLRNQLQCVIDYGAFEWLNVPRLKALLKEVKNW